MRPSPLQGTWLVWLPLVLGLVGCWPATSPEAHFYQLSAIHAEKPASLPHALHLGIGPVHLPETLDRPQIVTRTGSNELLLAEYHRWGGDLREEVKRVLAEDLGQLLPGAVLENYPWRHGNLLTHQVEVTVLRFDGVLGQEAALEAQWSIWSGQGERLLLSRTTRLREPISTPDYTALVAAQSRLLGHLSMEVAEALRQIAAAPQNAKRSLSMAAPLPCLIAKGHVAAHQRMR